MDYSLIVLGGAAALIFTAITALLYQILQFIEENPEVALKKLFLKPKALKGFKVMAVSTAALAIPQATEMTATTMGNTETAMLVRYLMPIPMLGYLYFYIQLYDTTKPYSHE